MSWRAITPPVPPVPVEITETVGPHVIKVFENVDLGANGWDFRDSEPPFVAMQLQSPPTYAPYWLQPIGIGGTTAQEALINAASYLGFEPDV